ncbi:phosphotransferase family protein [Streptomyces sp. NBC_00083]|uniref:phosphotransferase family protein n=1 Tax=Streptomyces sp. NBC_00083 TaxID=2975647 RepID=UPI0022544989|nr:aminoglycoside phosphotransferase family protein [Streptomyces sp. NBC_00083]MCX5382715.1 aminoglycoside phosphotransferase family protein [Streptomyces sp. NBC_00083]
MIEAIGAAGTGQSWDATRRWVEQSMGAGATVEGAVALRGGWTSEMRRLRIGGERPRSVVLRSFVKEFYVRHAPGLLGREAGVLTLLARTPVPAAELIAVDPAGAHCDHPSLLMSLLPGDVRIDDAGAAGRAPLLARQLLDIHRVAAGPGERPRTYEAWTAPDRVRVPEATRRPELWRRAIEVIRRQPPAYRPVFLHRDFHPGNVLFTGAGAEARVSGVVDWVETSWGPADLDVAHCSTNLALLHGVPAGLAFAERYTEAGGRLASDPDDRLYWRLLDALAFAPDAEKVAVPWRALGRDDLTPELVGRRLEEYVQAVLDQDRQTLPAHGDRPLPTRPSC